jgi:cyclase
MVSRRDFLVRSGMASAAWLGRTALGQTATPQTPSASGQAAPQPAPTPQTAPPGVQPEPNLLQELEQYAATETIRTTKLRDTLFLLEGVGGNIVCQIGPDGKLLVDAQMAAGTQHLQDALSKLDAQRLKLLVNTHWHPDHTDGNAALHLAGAFILAQINTRVRLSSAQYMAAYDLHVPAAPDAALPQQTFQEHQTLWLNNDQIDLTHAPYAHTDSDLFVHFHNGNVIHTGDLWFNGMYPLIDTSTGGTINGMIKGVDAVLALADDQTKIVPGHGPLGDKAALQTYRTMMVTVADRVEKLKAQGQTVEQAIAAKPTADLDATWTKPGAIQPNTFVALVYQSL